MQAKILITGGTGVLGRSLSALLTEHQLPHHITSRAILPENDLALQADFLSKKGITEAVDGKEIIFHLATDLKRDLELTRNLLEAIGVGRRVHLVYMSIVGIDKVPFRYYQQKLASEEAIRTSGIPFTILQATQFHEFIDQLLSTFLRYPVGLLPKKIRLQPIQKEIVAAELYRLGMQSASGVTHEMGGREIYSFYQLATEWLRHTRRRRRIIPLPLWGRLGTSFNGGGLTTLHRWPESISWSQWLTKQYGPA